MMILCVKHLLGYDSKQTVYSNCNEYLFTDAYSARGFLVGVNQFSRDSYLVESRAVCLRYKPWESRYVSYRSGAGRLPDENGREKRMVGMSLNKTKFDDQNDENCGEMMWQTVCKNAFIDFLQLNEALDLEILIKRNHKSHCSKNQNQNLTIL